MLILKYFSANQKTTVISMPPTVIRRQILLHQNILWDCQIKEQGWGGKKGACYEAGRENMPTSWQKFVQDKKLSNVGP
jgi:hypothetical protein